MISQDFRSAVARIIGGGLLTWIIVLAVLMLILNTGCAHTCKPVVVEVPIDNPGVELPLAEMPEWKTPTANPANPTEYLRALAYDLIEAWRVITEDRHTIEAHNKTIAATD